jgi:hypothetical protein
MRENSGQTDWYTPRHIVEFAHHVMGGIGLDPASTPEANTVVLADRIFTAADDGIARPWDAGTIFCNPPYGLGDITGKWYMKMVAEYDIGNFTHGLFLANATTETRWMQHALGNWPVLFLASRQHFWLPGGTPENASASGFLGSALVYLPARDVWPFSAGAALHAALDVPLNAPLEPPLYARATPLCRFLAAGSDLGQIALPLRWLRYYHLAA